MMTVFRGDALGPRGRWRLLIRVCGWHRKTFGYPRVPLGVKWSETWGISHGICAACAAAISRQRVAAGLLRTEKPDARARKAGL